MQLVCSAILQQLRKLFAVNLLTAFDTITQQLIYRNIKNIRHIDDCRQA
ncbi:hypothetical protein EVA_17891 [gut metagenome]|uniref:Uncharacterized protein n=1 Tax=gut metagenome TaxID=749906 RepID=J9FWQ5_9ZZZZ